MELVLRRGKQQCTETWWRQAEGTLSEGRRQEGVICSGRLHLEGPHGLWSLVRGFRSAQVGLMRSWRVLWDGPDAEGEERCREAGPESGLLGRWGQALGVGILALQLMGLGNEGRSQRDSKVWV